MLLLTRKTGEKIRIGDDIHLIVLRLNPDKVMIGFDAPEDVLIYREEIYRKNVLQKNSLMHRSFLR